MSGPYRVLLTAAELDTVTMAVQVNSSYHPTLGPAELSQSQRTDARIGALAALGRAKPDLTAELVEALTRCRDVLRQEGKGIFYREEVEQADAVLAKVRGES